MHHMGMHVSAEKIQFKDKIAAPDATLYSPKILKIKASMLA